LRRYGESGARSARYRAKPDEGPGCPAASAGRPLQSAAVTRSCISLTLLALVLALSACGGDDDSDKPAADGKARTEATKVRPPKEAAEARREREAEEEQERELKEQDDDDREFDRSFEESTFERQVGKLPVGEPPLYVEQYITGDGHRVYTAVDRKRFCKLSASKREQAVASFFKSADKSFRAAKVNDFEVIVTPLSDSIDKLPALASASGDAVKLTALGRRC
jgi:hypothetical protein